MFKDEDRLLPKNKNSQKCSSLLFSDINKPKNIKVNNLWNTLSEIKEGEKCFKNKEIVWHLINNLFLSLSQRQGEKTAILYCENVLKIRNRNITECLKNIFEEFNQMKNGQKDKSKLLELLIIDKSEALAERLLYTLTLNVYQLNH
ncbi:hypothetical protein Mgra_00005141 [Meloidogyne graminicola]|uniref:Uncharacterized protein n=1 Tax=Meloidogyne graminicola TaxID=189291 RepID=A0A8S9ZQB1_9BILA|nr:hypothetical protein Mgra_00005141 [Meloidogyne graminicola]